MQDNFPGVEPLEVDGSQQGVKEAGDDDDEGKGLAKAVQQLIRFVLLCKRPNVEEKNRVSLAYFGG